MILKPVKQALDNEPSVALIEITFVLRTFTPANVTTPEVLAGVPEFVPLAIKFGTVQVASEYPLKVTVPESEVAVLSEASFALTTGWVASAVSVLPVKLGEVEITSWVAAPALKTILDEAAVFPPEVAVKV